MYLFAQNRVRGYSGAVAARPPVGFGRVISRGGLNLVLTRVVTAPNDPPPPRYVIGLKRALKTMTDLKEIIVVCDITIGRPNNFSLPGMQLEPC